MKTKYIIDRDSARSRFIEDFYRLYDIHKYIEAVLLFGKQRTSSQQKALEVYCRLVAQELNRKGITFEVFFKEGYQVPWSQGLVKDEVWRPVQRAIVGKESTTEPCTIEYPKIYDRINDKLARHGIHVPWPEKEK